MNFSVFIVPLPASSRIWRWATEAPACQHAKCILVDGVTAFITSANFTESAHERNIELGVLFRENPKVAQSIRSKFESLVQNGFLKPLPAN